MNGNFSELFDNWPEYTQRMLLVYERLGALLTDLGIPGGEVRIIAFISSAWRGEMRWHESNGLPRSSSRPIQTNDKNLAEEYLLEMFGMPRGQTIFAMDSLSAHVNAYDEFGVIPGYDEICFYGIIIQCPHLSASKIVSELMNQISLYCKNVLDDKNFETEAYMLANIVYIALKKQIDIDFYNILAAISYEKRVAVGGILFVDETQQYNVKISFESIYPLEMKNVKEMRKLLEMTTEDLFLVSKNSNVIGLGEYNGCGDNFNYFMFNGHQMWSYYENGKEILSYKEGKYTFIFDENINFVSYFPDNFFKKENYEYLNAIIHEIRKQKHGTLLIISDNAKQESTRLCKYGRGYAIEPVDLKLPGSRNLLPSITSIDGAILIDTNCICYGLGVILDGIAVKTGLTARGARYNSAQCYIDNKEDGKFAAVVVSGDETIDIIHNAQRTARQGSGRIRREIP